MSVCLIHNMVQTHGAVLHLFNEMRAGRRVPSLQPDAITHKTNHILQLKCVGACYNIYMSD